MASKHPDSPPKKNNTAKAEDNSEETDLATEDVAESTTDEKILFWKFCYQHFGSEKRCNK